MDAHIEITKQDAEIEITSHRARVEISTQRPHFRMRRNGAQMSVDRRLPTMHLDRSLMSPTLDISQVAQAAREYYVNTLQSGLAARSASGTATLTLQNGQQTVAQLSAPSAGGMSSVDVSALQAADIRWDPGYLNINWTPGSVDMDWDTSTWADIHVEPQYVEIRMVKYPEIKIRVIYDPKKDNVGGKYIDKYL